MYSNHFEKKIDFFLHFLKIFSANLRRSGPMFMVISSFGWSRVERIIVRTKNFKRVFLEIMFSNSVITVIWERLYRSNWTFYQWVIFNFDDCFFAENVSEILSFNIRHFVKKLKSTKVFCSRTALYRLLMIRVLFFDFKNVPPNQHY